MKHSGALKLVQALHKDADKLRSQPYRARPNQTRIKALLLARHGAQCEGCDTAMPAPSLLHVHHTVPISKGGPDEIGNCSLLCPNCHAKAHWLMRQGEHPECTADLLKMLRP